MLGGKKKKGREKGERGKKRKERALCFLDSVGDSIFHSPPSRAQSGGEKKEKEKRKGKKKDQRKTTILQYLQAGHRSEPEDPRVVTPASFLGTTEKKKGGKREKKEERCSRLCRSLRKPHQPKSRRRHHSLRARNRKRKGGVGKKKNGARTLTAHSSKSSTVPSPRK